MYMCADFDSLEGRRVGSRRIVQMGRHEGRRAVGREEDDSYKWWIAAWAGTLEGRASSSCSRLSGNPVYLRVSLFQLVKIAFILPLPSPRIHHASVHRVLRDP